MTSDIEFKNIRPVNLKAIEDAGPDARVREVLFDEKNSTVSYIRTPVGGGSPEGTHTHTFDQIYYLISGTMSVEIDGEVSVIHPGTAVVFPAGVPHRNWNDEVTVHLAIKVAVD